MHFTREPVIETVITPREGCKLVVRSSKAGGEDYYVDAVEVVSFGNSFFYRSLERPKSFLLPVGDYEVIELKETRMVLKNASSEKSVKIGSFKKEEEEVVEKTQMNKKRRYRTRRRTPIKKTEASILTKEILKSDDESLVEKSSFVKALIPPPTTLIKEKLQKEKIIEEQKSVEAPILEDATAISES